MDRRTFCLATPAARETPPPSIDDRRRQVAAEATDRPAHRAFGRPISRAEHFGGRPSGSEAARDRREARQIILRFLLERTRIEKAILLVGPEKTKCSSNGKCRGAGEQGSDDISELPLRSCHFPFRPSTGETRPGSRHLPTRPTARSDRSKRRRARPTEPRAPASAQGRRSR